MPRELTQKYIAARRNHAAWLLLASPKGPLILASLKSLLETLPNGIDFDEAVTQLAATFADFANDPEFELTDEPSAAARRELRQWLKRGLIVERSGRLFATDALQRAIRFLDSLDNKVMTSTASRLATVQQAIESLESRLSPSQAGREKSLRERIDELQKQLAAVQAGQFEVLDGLPAIEGIREVYQLAVSLQADFRRVEDSYRNTDRELRQRIISENQNRGEIVDQLLNSHEALIQTPEGQVFETFHAQLVRTAELEEMKSRLRSILDNSNTVKALPRQQQSELQQLVTRLVQESERVIQARARSERDVRGFLKSGLVDEQIRVGALLQELFQVALAVDWQSNKLRRSPSPLPPIANSMANLPLAERLLPKQIDSDEAADLELTINEADPAAMDDEFWQAFHSLDRKELFERTIQFLRESGRPLTIGELTSALPPTHDLETLVYWLTMARQAGLEFDATDEIIDLLDTNGRLTRFTVPSTQLLLEAVETLDAGALE